MKTFWTSIRRYCSLESAVSWFLPSRSESERIRMAMAQGSYRTRAWLQSHSAVTFPRA